MSDDETLGISVRYERDMPSIWREQNLEGARRDVAIKLFKYLMRPGFNQRHSVVNIQVDDQQIDLWMNEYRLKIRITEAENQIIKIAMPEFEIMPLSVLSLTAVGELKRRIKNKLHSIFHHGE